MDVSLSLWSYISQWVGYLSWCASASDPACRPFVAFLALSGASFGALSILVLGIVGILNSWEREIDIVRATAAEVRRAEAIRDRLRRVPRAEPALSLGAAAVSLVHGEPVLAMRAEAAPARAAGGVRMPLGPTL